MKLISLVVFLLVAHLVAASSPPCNPALFYHGPDCKCGSQLPLQVQTTSDQKPTLQYQITTFAIRQPHHHHHGEDQSRNLPIHEAQMQHTEQPRLQQKLMDMGYQIRTPSTSEEATREDAAQRFQYNLQGPMLEMQPGQLMQPFVQLMDLPRHPLCTCQGPSKCQYASHNHDDSARNSLRLKRSTDFKYHSIDDVSHNEGDTQWPAQFKQTDDFYKNLQGDMYVVERVRQKRGAEHSLQLDDLMRPLNLEGMNWNTDLLDKAKDDMEKLKVKLGL